ncbi:unnamed protein product [Penicillium bialowiezense]
MANEFPPYVPMPSLAHELGLMTGFFCLCLAVMAAYVVIWRVSQRRLLAQDLARRKALRNNRSPLGQRLGTTTSIVGGTRSPSPTKSDDYGKIPDCYTIPEDRVELPVHGMELLKSGNAHGPRMGPLTSHALNPLGSKRPKGLLDSGSAAEILHPPRAVASPTGGGVESIIGLALSPPHGRTQSPVRVGVYRSESPARRAGGQSGLVEIGPGSY